MREKIPNHFIDFLESKGMSNVEIMETLFEFRRKGLDNWKDLVWSLLQSLSLQCAANATSEEQFYKDQHDIYSEMLYLRRKYERQKANDIWALLNNNKLRIASCSNLIMTVGVACDNRCEYSSRFKDKWFKMEDVWDKELIDMGKCSNIGGCTCLYTCKPMRDENGGLKRKKG